MRIIPEGDIYLVPPILDSDLDNEGAYSVCLKDTIEITDAEWDEIGRAWSQMKHCPKHQRGDLCWRIDKYCNNLSQYLKELVELKKE